MITAIIAHDGTITVGPIDPEDYTTHREGIMRIMSTLGSTVVETECLEPSEVEAIVRRLADLARGRP